MVIFNKRKKNVSLILCEIRGNSAACALLFAARNGGSGSGILAPKIVGRARGATARAGAVRVAPPCEQLVR